MTLRLATEDDLPEMKQLYVDTIQEVCKKDYGPAELKQWSSSVNKTQRWIELINEQHVLIAEVDHRIAGYASLKEASYIDFFYVHKDFQRKGIAQALLHKIEEQAKAKGSRVITSDISITARPFFEKNGYAVVTRQENVRENATLINFKMRKEL